MAYSGFVSSQAHSSSRGTCFGGIQKLYHRLIWEAEPVNQRQPEAPAAEVGFYHFFRACLSLKARRARKFALLGFLRPDSQCPKTLENCEVRYS